MPSREFLLIEKELTQTFGDILAKGILSQALKKVGATPETVTKEQMRKAIEGHIRNSVTAFMGGGGANDLVVKLKKKLAET